MRRIALPFVGIVFLLASPSLFAQPANDLFANAWTLTGGTVRTNGNSTGATKEAGEPNHANLPGGRSVWFAWTAPKSATVRIDTFDSGFNTLLGVYTGNSVSALTLVAQNDDAVPGFGGNNRSRVEFPAVAGTTYRIAIDGRAGFQGTQPSSGPYILNIQTLASVIISPPTNGSIITAGTPILIHVEAEVPNPPVTRVDFYWFGSQLASDDTAPFETTLSSPVLGTNQFVAVAIDGAGLSWTSSVVNVTVLNVGVTIVAPQDGSYYAGTNPIPITAVGHFPAGGSLTNVEFLVDGVKIGEDAQSPFGVSWTTVTPGSHRLTARATSNNGTPYESSIYIGVASTLIARGAAWKYLDNGSDQGTNWISSGFNDSTWASGPAELGYGDGDEATVVASGPAGAFYITTYFRRTFVVDDPTTILGAVLSLERDDAGVVYINGREVLRSFNLPAPPTPITASTLALGNGIEDTTDVDIVFGEDFLPGTNVIAVEIHQQSQTSSDISFNLELLQYPVIVRNLAPLVTITTPTNNAYFLNPASLPIEAISTDDDGDVVKVEFFADGNKLGEDTVSPYSFTWDNPAVGVHTVRAVTTDNQGATGFDEKTVVIYDAAGNPLVRVTAPTSGSTFDGPTNLTLLAQAVSPIGIANVEFRNKGTLLGTDSVGPPYSYAWNNATFGTNEVTAIAVDTAGVRATSAVVTVIVKAPPPNLFAPSIVSVLPDRGEVVGSLPSIQVNFSERVIGVDASDLLLNGVPATGVTATTTSNYVFTFPRPAYGTVNITWANDANIFDVGFPPFGFDGGDPDAIWSYTLIDTEPPTIVSRTPPTGAVITNLTQITISFSEPIRGIDAADLLVNGTAAIGLSSAAGTNYTFSFRAPAAGTVNVSWLASHGITDLATPPNAFTATAPWTYTLDNRTILVQSNGTWRFVKGLAEASTPIDAWRGITFDDSGWSNALAPFYYGDPYGSAANPGTLLSDMLGGYSSIYLRRNFTVPFAAAVSNLFLVHQSDDGFIAWINGVEVFRYNMGQGDIPYNGSAPSAIQEQGNAGAPYLQVTLPNPSAYLVNGVNVLAVHAFNNQPATSTDFGMNAQLYTFVADPSTVPPTVIEVAPKAGEVFYLTNITVTFSESVSGVDASDLRVNGVPATSMTSSTNNVYTFHFPAPAFGQVNITWSGTHGIQDSDSPPKSFDGAAPGANFSYSYINPSAPTVASQTPLAGATVNALSQLTVNFSEPVTGVNAGDLLINGLPATGVAGGPVSYTFTLNQPPYGNVSIGWAGNAGISDLEVPSSAFDPTRAANLWTYTLIDQTPPTIVSQVPVGGTQVLNLTSITVEFSEPVTGVNAADLLINGVPASTASGGGSSWTFTFPQPNATIVNVTWANAHGIRDLAPVPNTFDGRAAGATWTYTTIDNLAPQMAALSPPAGATVRSLTQIIITFTEPVAGVGTNDLFMNNRPALGVSGSGAGPYTFNFLAPSNGLVELRWVIGHGISDLASPPNTFPGGDWTYVLDPNASFAGAVIISEIMFNPQGGRTENEWLELLNVSPSSVNLTGWKFSRGVDFTFPNVSIAPGAYLVVAANTNAFRTLYPDVHNVTGGWVGRLGNREENVRLETALGELVNEVHYATEGDWAVRERGHGARRVEAVSVAGNTASLTIFGHGYSGNDRVMISGADQAAVNGIYTIQVANPSTININLSTAVTPTGNLLCRHVIDEGASGWSWFSAADGLGSSLELVNRTLPNTFGQNWRASTALNGTPGIANSVNASDIAPLILDVRHFPMVPKSSDPVTITARIRDDRTNGPLSVQVFYRNHTTTPNGFLSATMLDNGLSGDGVAGDGLYGASLVPQGNGTIIEFYVQAADPGGLSRTWPAAAWDTNNVSGQLANAYYQVDDEVISNTMPVVRVIMSGTERNNYGTINQNSDAEQNITAVITDGDNTEVRYGGGLRIRGAGSRGRNPKNNRVNLPNDRLWKDMSAINLNAHFVHAQLMGAAVSRKAGLPASDAYVVQYRMNGVNLAPQTAPTSGTGNGAGYGTFILVQPVNGDLGADLFPEDEDGNVYRASTGNHNADFSYQGINPTAYLTRGYTKTANQTENDWTDLIRLNESFSTLNDTDFMSAVRTNINVEFWMRYFAVGSLINYGETSLFNGRGDDYAMYRGINDPRFVLIGHDFDTIFGQGDTLNGYAIATNSSPFIMMSPPFTGGNSPNVPLIRRLMTNEAYVPFFFSELLRLSDGVFHPSQLNPQFDQMLSGWGPSSTTIDAMKSYAANRRANILAQIPLALTVGHSLSTISNGLPYTTSPTVTLFGDSHAVHTRKVLVNGVASTRVAWQARWTNAVTLRPGVNRLVVQSLNSNDVEFARSSVDIWYDDGSVTSVSGTLSTDTVWSAANGPYQVTGNLTVAAGTTLTIQAGTTVWLGTGVNLIVANGGRLVAEGTDTARIRISAAPGVANWGGITINGAGASPESRIVYTHIDGNGDTAIEVADGTAFLSHLTFGNTARQYLSLDRASFVVEDCVFPAITGSFEPTHGSGGIKAGGRGIFQRNFFGRVRGYNDSLDFTGGNRPGPILQVFNNVFMGSDDDLLDLDSTDAWVEGNIFLHTHRNGSPDSASAVSGGADNADTSQITIVRNLFYDVDHAANAKQGNFYTMVNNTIVHQSRIGSQDTNTAVIILADVNEQGVFTAEGAGIYLEGNVILDAENLTRHLTSALVTFSNNVIHQLSGPVWAGPGGNNLYADPLLKHIPPFSETTNFSSWAAAQVMWDYFSLLPGSPAAGRGPNGRDSGGVVAPGASVAGQPVGTTPNTTALLTVGYNQTTNGVPVSGFPNGSGHTHYRWRLDGGAWSTETPTATPIFLSNLGPGPHFVEVSGRNDAGFYQDDPIFGTDAQVSVSRTWTVDPTASPLRITEVLAANGGVLPNGQTTPDAIELFNSGNTPFNLGGVRLTDDPANPDKFIFPAGAILPANGYLVVFADDPSAAPGYHLGFSLNEDGDRVYAYASVDDGGALLDSVQFGLQLTDLSIGRMTDGTWALTVPTFGAANRRTPVGDPSALRINEWLAGGTVPFNQDFVELYNSSSLPVELGGLYLTDELVGNTTRHRVAALSFIAGFGYQRFIADGDIDAGADHLDFSLGFEQGEIGLFRSDLRVIDCVVYQPQHLNVSQGRSPNGSSTIVFLSTPTPGAPNPLTTVDPSGGALVLNEVLANNGSLVEAGRTPDWVELYNGTTNTIQLGDMSLTDDTLRPRRFVIPAGTSLSPAGRLRVICDPENPNSGALINTNFALKSAGGGVYLFDALSRGGSLLNSVVYGLQTADLSIGRVPDGTPNWMLNLPSPGTANLPATLGPTSGLRVSEWLADPVPGEDDWFEIYNSGTSPVALGGLYLTDDLNNRTKQVIAPLSFLGTGTNAFQQFIADGNTGAGADHVSFSLRGAGEAVGISSTNGTLIDGYAFGAQTQDISEGRFPDGSTNVVAFPGTSSPGDPNWRWLTGIVINEVLTHTDEPLEDAIELRNLTGTNIDVGGWWLSDDNRALQKYQIPAPRVIPPNGFIVIYETVFTNDATADIPFALSSGGDEVVLSGFSAGSLNGYRTRVTFGGQFNGVSFGRYLTSDNREEFVAMEARTFGVDDPSSVEEFREGTGLTNTGPRIGPVVISEIMYHPPDVGTNDNVIDEFIELRNITTAPVSLYDPAHPENGWRLRDAVDFDFSSGTEIAANGYLLIVGFDPIANPAALAAFRSRYNVSSSTPIVGPWSGRLANDSEDIELRRPDAPNPVDGDVPYVLVERVHYFDTAPWPAGADGTGQSLQRIIENQFGNDPINWTADSPTPGPQSSNQDTDDDGLPDNWEILHGFDPLNPLDGGLDADGDGLSNVDEYEMGTDPRNPASGVSITSISPAVLGVSVKLVFTAAPNKAYAIQFSGSLGTSWQTVQTVAEAPTARVVELILPATGSKGFYRLSLVQPGVLRIDSIEAGGGQVRLTFNVPANAPCILQFKSVLGPGGWGAAATYPAAPTNRVVNYVAPIPSSSASGYYRLQSQ